MKEIKCKKELNEEFIKVNKTSLTYFEPVIIDLTMNKVSHKFISQPIQIKNHLFLGVKILRQSYFL